VKRPFIVKRPFVHENDVWNDAKSLGVVHGVDEL
jgi:hypothetical protein